MASNAWCWWLLPAAAGVWLASCTYDFDAAFSQPPTPTGTGATGGATPSGGGGSGATGGEATAGSGGVGGGGGQGTGAQSGGENCANNVDDDDDQYVDCADPDCLPDWECTQPAPADWEGPSMFIIGTPGSLPSCAAPWGNELPGGNGLTVPDATCNGCGCDAPTIVCTNPRLRLHDQANCIDGPNYETPSGPNLCESDYYGGLGSISVQIGNPDTGTQCAPNGGGVQTLPAASWVEEARLCSGTVHTGGCSNNNLCVPRDELSPFARCIYRAGSFGCPPPTQPLSPYTNEYTFNSSMTEGRDCSACSCDFPDNVECDSTFHLWDGSGSACTQPADATISTTEACVDAGPVNGNYEYQYTPAYTADPCDVSTGSGQPTGTVTEADPYTVCCLPS